VGGAFGVAPECSSLAKTSFRPRSKCRSISEHNGAMKRPLPAGKAPRAVMLPSPHVNPYAHGFIAASNITWAKKSPCRPSG
jgi:hypothetical protein